MSTRTIAETRELCRGSDTCDPLHGDGPEAEAQVIETPEGLLLLGTHYYAPDGTEGSGEYADDLLITPEGEGWRLRWRDPEGLPESVVGWGREWVDGGHHDDWRALVLVAYSL